MATRPARSGSCSKTECRLMTASGVDQSIEWSASTITTDLSHRPLLFSRSTSRATWRSVSTSASRRCACTVVPVKSACAEAVDVAEVDEHQVGVHLLDHVEGRVHGEDVGGVPADRDHRLRLPAVGRPVAEDAVEVLLGQHGAGGEPGPVQPADDGGELQVPLPVEGADLAELAVVDGVGRDVVPVGTHPGHHHHVVRDGLHDRHRLGARVVEAARAQSRQGGRELGGDLTGLAAVHDQRRRRGGDPWRRTPGRRARR